MHVGIATLAATEIGYKYGFAAFVAALIAGVVMIIIGRTGFITDFTQYALLSIAPILVSLYAVFHVGRGAMVDKPAPRNTTLASCPPFISSGLSGVATPKSEFRLTTLNLKAGSAVLTALPVTREKEII